MNNKHIQELTFRLSQALDKNYDVVNLDAVLSVISALEGATITKEQLEATRLAKYINQLRRRTKSEQLARRAKSLLKKWREMVGIQQQTNESLSNQNVLATTSTQHQQLYHRSQPTSPIVGSSVIDQIGVSNADKLSSGVFFRSTASNPALASSSTLQSANNKRLVPVSGANLSNVPIPTVPANGGSHSLVQLNRPDITSQKQPTSFANLLKGINSGTGGQVSVSNMSDLLSSPSSRMKSNKRKERNASQTMGSVSVGAKTFGLDQSSSSNADLSRSSALRNQVPISNMVPIVIDIQDSNSDSDIIGPTPTPTTPTTGQQPGSAPGSASKLKKSKKDKKRKERETQQQGSSLLLSSINANITNVIDESCSNQQKPSVDQEDEKFVPIVDDRSRVIYPISGISEILSLSNSSMSSMFPNSTAVASTVTDFVAASDKHKIEAPVGSNSNAQNKSLSTSDLTFAGKFKQHSSSGSSELFAFNGNRTDASTVEVVVNDSSSSHVRTSTATYTFVPFSGSGCNSNDSTSNSRTSQFDIIDVVNQDSQSKIIDELRQQHKKHNIISTQQTQSLQKPSTSVNVSDQILMPPTSTTTLRQLNNIGESNVATTDPKIPKKRGRKKGSKGVDSIIAKETSLCSQMLMTTFGCKKVKTTKELYTEMQNRKLGVSSTTSSPTMSNWLSHQQLSHISRPNSSCSEPSLHSPRTSDACSTNATVSTVATRSSPDKTTCYNSVHGEIDITDTETNTSGPSRDSATANSHIIRRPSTDSTSNSQLPTKVTPKPIPKPTKQVQNPVTVESLKQQIKELLSQLPPVPTMEKIEWESIKDVIPCTCKVFECEPIVDAELENTETTSDANASSSVADLNKNDVNSNKQQLDSSIKILNSKSMKSNQTEGIEDDVKLSQPVQPPPPKPMRSIFDLDFDDDEDPLHQIRAEAAATPAVKIETEFEEVKTEEVLKQETLDLVKLDSSVLPIEFSIEHLIPEIVIPAIVMPAIAMPAIVMPDQVSVQLPPAISFPTYSVEEDPKCEAKERFELQVQKATKFHVTALHNCYIPNVNGNWDNAETAPAVAASITAKVKEMTEIKVENKMDKKQPVDKAKPAPTTSDLWKNVVPQYGSLITEYIPKDLSHVTFTPNFIPKKSSKREKPHYYLPFLGVARKYLKSKEFSKKRKLKRTQKHKSCEHLAPCKEEPIYLPENNVLEENCQNIKTETNNNNDHVYVKCDISSECVNISLITTPVPVGIEQECSVEEHSFKTNLNDNATCLAIDNSSNQMLSSDIDGISSNIVYSGITIDIAEDLSVEPAENLTKINYDVITRNLLTIAKFPGNTNTDQVPQPNQYENAANYLSYENQNDQNVNNNSAPATSTVTTSVMLTEEKSVSLLSSCSTSEKHADSRRSSSCSNSSLKQTQNSINMKLRRRRLEQQKQEEINKLSAARQKSCGKRNRKKGVATKEKKPRVIKTIKLAINGNVTKQLPIPMGSSSNSTDDDDDEYKYNQNSVGSKSSHFDDDVLDEYKDVSQDSFAIEEYIEQDHIEKEVHGGNVEEDEDHGDEYDDGTCDGYDDDYGYVGDYHEVVTRNISATSTGNNHIVLTIKKTPSKTNSPSDSLSAMSPVVTSAQATVTKSVEIVEPFNENTDLTLIDNDVESLKLTNDAVNSCDNDIVEVVVQTEDTIIETLPIQDTDQVKQTVSQVFEDTNTASTHIEIAASPTFLIEAKSRRKRRIKKVSKCSDNNARLNRKLHNRLFFAHELQTIAFGGRSNIHNISSCSSSCDEDSEYEFVSTTDDDDIERKVHKTPQSPQPLPNIISYHKDQQNSTKTAICTTWPSSDSETANSASSHASENEGFDGAVRVRKKSKAGQSEHTKEGVIKQNKRQKKKRHRLIKPKGNVNATDENTAVVKTEAEIPTMPKLPDEDKLALENNGLLVSFNNIYVTPEQVEQNQRMARRMNSDDDVEFIESVTANEIDIGGVVYIEDFEEKKQQQQRPNENCDVYSNFYNYNNNSKLDNSYNSVNDRINSSNNSGSHNENETEAPTASSDLNINDENTTNNDTQNITNTEEKEVSSKLKLLVPHKEYRTGLRAVDEDVDDEDGNNCARIQQFKEWHQVLQLRSYNDELLTVMPYVVLE